MIEPLALGDCEGLKCLVLPAYIAWVSARFLAGNKKGDPLGPPGNLATTG